MIDFVITNYNSMNSFKFCLVKKSLCMWSMWHTSMYTFTLRSVLAVTSIVLHPSVKIVYTLFQGKLKS